MIHMICSDKCIQAHGVIGLFPAFSDGDDIKLLDEEKSDVIATFFGLRQQVRTPIQLFFKGSAIIKYFSGRERERRTILLPFRFHFP